MNNGHRPRWTAIWFERQRSVTIEPQSDGLFDPHGLSNSETASGGINLALVWSFYLLAILSPSLILGWFTFEAANFYYQSPYAGLLAAIVAGSFLLAASNQYKQLRTKTQPKDLSSALRFVRFVWATLCYFAIMLVATYFALRIENYSLHVLAGNYAPYLLHHLLLLPIVFYSWTWYESLIRGKADQKDRQSISGRSVTSDDEAQRRRKDLFR